MGIFVRNLDATVERLRASRVVVVVEPFEDAVSGFFTAIIQDNAGHLIQLFDRQQ